MESSPNSRQKWISLPELLVIAAAAIILFFNLGALPVQPWDEARNGQNAYEMLKNGSPLVQTYLNQPDYWNSKPPLLFWSMEASYKIFGINPFAMRFPSALFGLLTIFLIMSIARSLYDERTAFFSGLVLTTVYGFIHFHAARKGDFDSLLTLTIVLSLYFFIQFIKTDKKTWLLFFSGLAAGLAFLTKSFAVIQLAAILLTLMLFEQYRKKIGWKQILLWICGALLPVLIWAIFRFQADGLSFFNAMLGNDIVSRTTAKVDNLPTFSLWYFGVILAQFAPWSLFLFFIPFYKNRFYFSRTPDTCQFKAELNPFYRAPIILIWAVVPFVLFSLVTTKVDWYMVPIYPALSIIVGWHIARWDEDRRASGKKTGNLWTIGTAAYLTLFVVVSAIVVSSQEKETDQKLWMTLKPEPSAIIFLKEERNQADLYIANAVKGFPVREALSMDDALSNIRPGEMLFTRNSSNTNISGLELQTNSPWAWWFKK